MDPDLRPVRSRSGLPGQAKCPAWQADLAGRPGRPTWQAGLAFGNPAQKAAASWALPSLSGASIRRSTVVVIGRRVLGGFPPRPYTSECHQVLSLTPVVTNVRMGEADREISAYSEPLRGSILSFVGASPSLASEVAK